MYGNILNYVIGIFFHNVPDPQPHLAALTWLGSQEVAKINPFCAGPDHDHALVPK
jgi:hypothetical protein